MAGSHHLQSKVCILVILHFQLFFKIQFWIYDRSSKLDEIKITDFDTIGKILDATIEEDCELPSCPSGYSILIQLRYSLF